MMLKLKRDLVVIGGGPAGMAAADKAYDEGIEEVLILERDFELGGILPQCIHNGFGLHHFKEELTGPEYAQRYIDLIARKSIEVKLDTMVLDITVDKKIYAMNSKDGFMEIEATAIVLAMGCRERTAGAIGIPGTRPAGVLTAGTAQRFTNIEGFVLGKEVVILGSGDIGLIMARRMRLEGANVKAVVELLPYTGGLTRNVVQCLEDYDIPLLLNHTVTNVKGENRIESVIISEVDEKLKVIPGTEKEFSCDTLLLSVGLIPENELSKKAGVKLDQRTKGPIVNEGRETSISGIFACGNVLHVHDLVDYVTEEAVITGYWAARFIKDKYQKNSERRQIKAGKNVNYVVPQYLDLVDHDRKKTPLYMRVSKPLTNVDIKISLKGNTLLTFKQDYARPGEMININLPEKILNEEENIEEITIDIIEKGVH